jgi:hypothetical protein
MCKAAMDAFLQNIAQKLKKRTEDLTLEEVNKYPEWDKLMYPDLREPRLWAPYRDGRLTDFAIRHSAELNECDGSCDCGRACNNKVVLAAWPFISTFMCSVLTVY